MNPGNIQQPTSNIQHPINAHAEGHWLLGVRGWMLDVFHRFESSRRERFRRIFNPDRNMNRQTTIALLIAFGLIPAPLARADELGDKGREIFKKNQRAVVTVQIVLKTKYSMPGLGGQDSESRQDLTGTVVDPSGLTVLALSATDPGNMFQRLMAGMAGEEEDMKIKFESELTDVKILLEDGTELPAEVGLRDKDLELAFVRPKTQPHSALAAIEL